MGVKNALPPPVFNTRMFPETQVIYRYLDHLKLYIY